MFAILLKEFKSRMRGWRTPVLLTLYVGLLADIAHAQAQSISESLRLGYGGANPAAQGIQIFSTLAGFQLALLIFLTPAISAGALAGERERQTFDLLRCTGLSAPAIVLGKYLASMAFVLLLLWAAVPVFSLAFLFGGVTPLSVGLVMLLCFATALAITAVTILLSAIFHRVQVVTALAYVIVFLQTVGIGIVSGFGVGFAGAGTTGPPLSAFLSPIGGLVSLLDSENTVSVGIPHLPLPFYPARTLPRIGQAHLALWQIHIVIDLVIAVVALTAAAAVIAPVRLPRWGRR